ncbi:MAG: TetR/AcrR family transcriptional regulator [Bryobacteraceae bacterium]|nr:TetR/AcrR family transcriptional regulator [Bryobacteraceae bacterium]
MAVPKVSDDALIERIAHVFRIHGYEGASIRLLSEATGLERASLYHRYPGGKEEMASAVITWTGNWFRANVIEPLANPSQQPSARLQDVARNLKEFYERGSLPCVLDCMTIGSSDPIRDKVRESLGAWTDAFAGLARETGIGAAESRNRAQQAIIEIEGALVVTRVLNDPKPFLKTLDRLKETLLH